MALQRFCYSRDTLWVNTRYKLESVPKSSHFKTIITVTQLLVAILKEIVLEHIGTYFVFATLMRALANNIGHSSDWQVEAGRSSLFSSLNGMESSIVIFLQQP